MNYFYFFVKDWELYMLQALHLAFYCMYHNYKDFCVLYKPISSVIVSWNICPNPSDKYRPYNYLPHLIKPLTIAFIRGIKGQCAQSGPDRSEFSSGPSEGLCTKEDAKNL